MPDSYSPGEILKIAVEVERTGQELYAALELESQTKDIKDTWAYLKEQEGIHQKTFQEMLDKQADYLIAEFSPGEHQAYLQAISSEYIFTQDSIKKHLNQRFENDRQAIDFAIKVEKVSILTYAALKEYISKDKQGVLDKIIAEEKGHLARLKKIKRTVL